MKKSLALAAALALPMMAFSLPTFAASHAKPGDAAAPAVSEEHKAAMTKACESAADKDKCMADQMAEHAKGGMKHDTDAAAPAAAPAAPAAQ